MTAAELEAYLHEHIPISHAMQVAVVELSPDSVVLAAPLAPNINHRETVFGGSASAVAILAAWSLLHTRLTRAEVSSRLVIQRSTMSYDLPISGAFTARAALADDSEWETFTRTLLKKRRARITVPSVLEHAGKAVGRLEGVFVALR